MADSALPRCATCRHWGEPDAQESTYATPHGYCQAPNGEPRGLKVLDRHGKDAGLYTAATFGCTLHEPK